LALVPPGTTIVTAGHVPLRTAAVFDGYEAEGPMRSLLTVKGRAFYRHVVRNVPALLEALKPHPLTLALQGHTHEGERLRLFDGTETRYHTAPSVTATPGLSSGFFVYRVRGGTIDDGERVLLDPQE
ncbi:MAG TPA: hypothetical protein VI589_16480, partial [Vicinamibacteria bacterium]